MTEDGAGLRVFEAPTQSPLQRQALEEGLEHHEPGEGSQLLVLESNLGGAQAFQCRADLLISVNMLSKLSHIALIVRDPSRTASLFADIFGAKTVRRTDEDGHNEHYVQLGETWFVLAKVDVERPLTGDHVAFLVSPSTLTAVAERLAAIGHKYQLARSDTALYFSDFDNHVFELDSVGVESEFRE